MGRFARAVVLALICRGLVVGVALGQSTADTLRARQDARHLLQGEGELPFLDPAAVDSVARALLHIRAEYPDLADITHHEDDTYMVVVLDERGEAEATKVARLENRVLQRIRRDRVGLPVLDSLNSALGADSSTVVYYRDHAWRVIPGFRRTPNVPVLSKMYRGVPGVRYATADVGLGAGGEPLGFLSMERSSELWTFIFGRMWGDCPSGCIHSAAILVRYSPLTKRMSREEGPSRL
jgi:hypothetical protein